MSKVQSDTLYKDIEVLKGKLLSVKGEMADDLYNLVEGKIKVAEEKVVNLSEDPSMAELMDILRIISEVEIKYLDDKSVKEMSKNAQRKGFASQLATIEGSVGDNVDKVDEYMAEAKAYWDSIKEAYGEAEQAPIVELLTGIDLRCVLEKARKNGEVDISRLPEVNSSVDCRAVIKFMLDKKEKLDDVGRSSVELWLGKVIDKSTGKIDINQVKSFVDSEKFWRVLSGNDEVVLRDEDKKRESVDDRKNSKPLGNAKDKESDYDKKLKAFALEYDVPWKKLITKKEQIAVILRDDRGKCSVKKFHFDKMTDELKDKLRDECVVIIFNNSIDYIPSGSFMGFLRLEQVILPDLLLEIDENAFCNTGIKEVIFPKCLRRISFSAFSRCRMLENVEFNEGLSTIGNYAFYNSSVTEIKTPKSLRSMGDFAFAGCTKLKVAQLNDGLNTIGRSTFSGSGIEEIEIPETIAWIADQGSTYRSDYISSINYDHILSKMNSLETVKEVDSERNVINSYKVEVTEQENKRYRKLFRDFTRGGRQSRRFVGMDR